MNPRESAVEEGTQHRFHGMNHQLYSPHELYAVAEYMERDPDLWMFRRFGALQMFNILCIQQRLTSLESEFQRRSSSNPRRSCNDLVPDIQQTLKEYNDALAAQAKFRSYLKPEAHVLADMEDWSRLHEPALRAGLKLDADRGQAIKDIAAIGATEKTWVHKFIDRHRRLRGLFEEKPTARSRLWSTLIYYEDGVRRAEAVLIHVSFCILLVAPTVALLYVDSKAWKLVVLAVFLLVFSVLSIAFLSTPNKVGLGLVAGYAAILVVFLSNNVGS